MFQQVSALFPFLSCCFADSSSELLLQSQPLFWLEV